MLRMIDNEEQNRKRLLKSIANIPQNTDIQGWIKMPTVAIGGLLSVGFSKQADMLLVESSQGLGLFECGTLQLIAREKNNDENIYDNQLQCLGIGPVKDELIPMAGIHGGGLRSITNRGEQVTIISPRWPLHEIVFCTAYSSVYDPNNKDQCQIIASEYEFRAYGFSSDDKYFIYATSSQFILYCYDS